MSPSPTRPLLLVDGYNIIGAWPELKEVRDRDNLETARDRLIEILINYSVSRALQTQIVFDAYYQRTPGCQETCTPYLSIYYTAFAQTADTYIEKICAAYARQWDHPGKRLIVATSDRAQQLTVTGYGAQWQSAQQLARDVELATRQTRRRHRPQKQSRGRFLFNSLDTKAQQRLAELREGRR